METNASARFDDDRQGDTRESDMKRTTFVSGAAAALMMLVSVPSFAAQIVAYDLKPIGGVKKSLAESLSPVLIAELSRREGMSVVSQADIRALLALETDKQMMGCDKESCLADIADSMGAELLATSTLARVGRDWVVSVTLLQVDGAKVLRRSTARKRGEPADAITKAIESSVHDLFKAALPKEIAAGPASLTRRGFEAALAGLHARLSSMGEDPRPSRKKIVLDLVNTELDYDTAPKYTMLDQAIRTGTHDLRMRAYDARGLKGVKRYLWGISFYQALANDLGRVKEIRERARAQGQAPTAGPLRFLDPEPRDLPSKSEVAAYFSAARPAEKVLNRAVKSFKKKQAKKFVTNWTPKHQDRAVRAFSNFHNAADKYGYTYNVLPHYAYLPSMQKRSLEVLDKDKGRKIYLWVKRSKKGRADRVMRVTMVAEGDKWFIESW